MQAGRLGLAIMTALLLGSCADAPPCSTSPVAVLNLTFRHSVPVVDTSVNGVDAPMIFDSGSEISIITPDLATKAHAYVLNGAGQLLSFGSADAATHDVTAVNSFTVGGLTGTQVQFDIHWAKTQQHPRPC